MNTRVEYISKNTRVPIISHFKTQLGFSCHCRPLLLKIRKGAYFLPRMCTLCIFNVRIAHCLYHRALPLNMPVAATPRIAITPSVSNSNCPIYPVKGGCGGTQREESRSPPQRGSPKMPLASWRSTTPGQLDWRMCPYTYE